MSLLKRRSFVETILATAASGSPACAAFYDGVSFRSPADTNTPSSTILENGAQQLRLSPVGTPLSFHNRLLLEREWKLATLPGVGLVSSSSARAMISHAS